MGVVLLLLTVAVQGADCGDARECRALALEAAAREDYETFHDFAWRAVQKGQPRDPELMFLLARAQALSDRPGDALVTLRRLAERGIANDAATSDDFARVRELPGWAEVQALMAGAVVENERTGAASSARSPAAGEALRLDERRFMPGGLAYDMVSRRFVLGDRRARKLFVVDEGSGRANDLVGAASAGFHAVMGLEIDARRGDLWVISATDDSAAEAPETVLHKLQLVSGRPLATFRPSAKQLPARFVDLAVAADGTVLALDAVDHRVLRVRPASRGFERFARLDGTDVLSLAQAPDAVYVSHGSGLSRIDASSRRVTAVQSGAGGVDLAGLERIRWHRGGLVAVQRLPGEPGRIVRLALDKRGRKVTALEVIEAIASQSAGSAATIAGDAFYYLAADEHGPVVKRVPLR